MIAIHNFTDWTHLRQSLETLQAQGYTHVVIQNDDITIYPDMLHAVTCQDGHILVDYTIDGWYQNDCRYFGQPTATFSDWMQNIQQYPNVIFSITQTLTLLAQQTPDTLLDLTLYALFQQPALATDGHVVLNFTRTYAISPIVFQTLGQTRWTPDTQFHLNKLAYQHRAKRPYRTKDVACTTRARFIDRLLQQTHFKLPHWLYRKIASHFMMKHRQQSQIYTKQPDVCRPYIVFLGFDFGYRGNSQYLFEYFTTHYPEFDVYFITDAHQGHQFISTTHPDLEDYVNHARVVIAESYIPDRFQPNGKVIQLWHGTPIKQLFLDSLEPHQNLNIYNYRARKYNKWLQQDVFVCDHPKIMHHFQYAFPMHACEIVPSGYPRIDMLQAQQHETATITTLRQNLGLDDRKPVLLYAPTWKQHPVTHDLLHIDQCLLDRYHIIFKGHVEAHGDNDIPEAVHIAPTTLETQSLILMSDVVLTDYSSIIFDALSIEKTVCLYTPNHETYMAERGVYADVWDTLQPVCYTNEQQLIHDLCHDAIPQLTSPYVQLDATRCAHISTYIIQFMQTPSS